MDWSLFCTWCPHLCGSSRRTMDGHWSSAQVYPSSISDTTSWQSTYSRSLMNIQFTPTSRVQKTYLFTWEERHLSFSALLLYLALFLYLFPPPLSTSLYMYNLNIGCKMQALISCACFISGVDQETFFLWHFEQANTILHRLRERKIPFVLCQHKHFNLRLSLLSKQQISSEAQRDTGNACGSFSLSLITRGTHHSAWPLCFYQSAGACISQKRGESAGVSAYK